MPVILRKWSTPFVLALAFATIVGLSARGMDRTTRSNGIEVCGDVNVQSGHDEWPASNCLEGHPCIVCDMPLAIGSKVLNGGNGDPLWNPLQIPCSGDRIVGVCVPNPYDPGVHCDRSLGWVDGTCGGNIVDWRGQPQPVPIIAGG